VISPEPLDKDRADGAAGQPDFVEYAEFGERFVRRAVTEQRVLRAVAALAGHPVRFGPIGVGPGGLVKASATGDVGHPALTRRAGDLVSFDMLFPVDLQLTVDLGVETCRFTAEVSVRLVLTARAAAPLSIVIDVAPPSAEDVRVTIHPDGRRASLVQVIGRMDGEVRKLVARHVGAELARPNVRQACVIDVAAALDLHTHPDRPADG
jgi:hypothetical protein